MIVRVTDSALDPEDLDRAVQLVREVVRPGVQSLEGCSGFEVHVRVDEARPSSVELALVSRWESRTAMDAAVRSEDYAEVMNGLRALLAESPIVRIFEAVD